MPGENYKILQINALNKLRLRLKLAALEDVEKTHHRILGRLHPGTVTLKLMQEYFDRKKNPIKVTPISPLSRYQKSLMTNDNFEYFPTPAMVASRLSWLPDVILKDPFPYATFNVTQSQDRTPTDKDTIWDSYAERSYEPVAGPRGDLTFENLPDNYSRIYQGDDKNYYTVDYRSNNDPLLLKVRLESPLSEVAPTKAPIEVVSNTSQNVLTPVVDSKKERIKKTQRFLIGLGYDLGKTRDDGIWGRKTLAAWEKYKLDLLMKQQQNLLINSFNSSSGNAATSQSVLNSRRLLDQLMQEQQNLLLNSLDSDSGPVLKKRGGLLNKPQKFLVGGVAYGAFGNSGPISKDLNADSWLIREVLHDISHSPWYLDNEIRSLTNQKKKKSNTQVTSNNNSKETEKTNTDNTKTNKDSWLTLKNTVKLVMDAAANNTLQNTNKNNWLTLNNVVKLAMDAARKEASKWSKLSKNNISNNNFLKTFEDTINNLTPDELSYLDFKGIDFSSAAKLLEGLNLHFNSGLVVDNKFGPKSQAALKNALRLMPLDESFKLRRPDYYGLTTPIVLDLVELTIPEVEYTIPESSPLYGNNNPNPVNLNRTDIRAILRHYGYNPYDFSGRLRRAFRKYLAGDRTQNIDFLDEEGNLYRDWVAPYTTFKRKLGGRLISKDPIKRFKLTI